MNQRNNNKTKIKKGRKNIKERKNEKKKKKQKQQETANTKWTQQLTTKTSIKYIHEKHTKSKANIHRTANIT